MKIACPHCGVSGSAEGSKPGDKVRCPQCEKVFKVSGQMVFCPHCGVAGSVGDSPLEAKFRCPQCEKVFLLTQELVDQYATGAVQAEAGAAAGGAPILAPEMEAPTLEAEPEAEPALGQVDMAPDTELEAEPELEWKPEPEAEPEPEAVEDLFAMPQEPAEIPVLEPIAEIAAIEEDAAEELPEELLPAEVEKGESEDLFAVSAEHPEAAAEPAEEIVAAEEEGRAELAAGPASETAGEPVLSEAPPAEDESSAEVDAEYAAKIMGAEEGAAETAEGAEATVLPAQICAGCGESFHPEFLQEVDSKPYCGVCQLRFVASEERQQAPSLMGGRLRGILAALLLLGLLVLLGLVLTKFGMK